MVTDREPTILETLDGTIIEVFEWLSPEAIECAYSNLAIQAQGVMLRLSKHVGKGLCAHPSTGLRMTALIY